MMTYQFTAKQHGTVQTYACFSAMDGPCLAFRSRQEGRKFTHPWQPTRLNGWNSVRLLVLSTESTRTNQCTSARTSRISGKQSRSSWTLLMNTVGIRPAQCVTPPPSFTMKLLQLQPFAAQAASPQQLLLCEIIIEIRVRSAECLAAAKQHMLGFP